MRLDKLIAERFALSRRAAQDAVRAGRVDVDGEPCLEPGLEVEPRSLLNYDPNRPRNASSTRKLEVLYEDQHILVVNKPAGVLTQPTQARERDTLLERAGRYLIRKHGRGRPYVGIVQRLDRDTSGVILMVIDHRALRPFQAIFREHAIARVYLAVVEGVFLTAQGRIDLPLVPDRGDGRRGVARPGEQGVPAVTQFEVLESFGRAASLVECRLETGRTHQVRIHLAELGHSVLGDRVYRPRTKTRSPVDFHRQALHARALEFVHPFTGQPVRLEAPVPADLRDVIVDLRDRFGSATKPT